MLNPVGDFVLLDVVLSLQIVMPFSGKIVQLMFDVGWCWGTLCTSGLGFCVLLMFMEVVV